MPGPDEQPLSDLERSLAGLQPATAGFDRDRLMFQAGRAAATRRRWRWPAATGLMTAVAACLGLLLVLRPEPAPVVRIVYVERPAPEVQPAPETPAPPSPVPPPSPAADESAKPGLL